MTTNEDEAIYQSSSTSDPISNDELIHTAVLYRSFRDPSLGCGHKVVWKDDGSKFIVGKDGSCPICNEPVSYIEDGLVVSSSSSSSSQDTDNNTDYITFKFGKIIYRLSVVKKSDVTAQERIGTVLGFDYQNGLKILSKGKVIYPITASRLNINQQQLQMSDMDISDMLIECSKQQTNQEQNKINFLVLGTTTFNQSDIQEKDKTIRQERANNNADTTTSNIVSGAFTVVQFLFNTVVDISRQLLVYSVSFTYTIVTTTYNIVFRPLLDRGAGNPRTGNLRQD